MMPMPHLRDYFVNIYRKVHGSNVGLSDAEIMRMSRKELWRNIRSLKIADEDNQKRRREAFQGSRFLSTAELITGRNM